MKPASREQRPENGACLRRNEFNYQGKAPRRGMTAQGLPGAAATWSWLEHRLPRKELALLRGFLIGLQSNLSRETYLYSIKRFATTYRGNLLAVTGDSLRAWVTASRSTMGRQTLKSTLIALRSFFRHVRQQVPGHGSPFDGQTLRLPHVRDAEGVAVASKVLTMEQLRTVLARLDEEEARVGHEVPGAWLFRFLSGTGLRLSEALSLNIWDPAREGDSTYCNYLRRQPDGRYVVRVLGKARRLREFQLSDELSAAVDHRFPPERVEPGAPVFTTLNGQHTRLSRHGAHWQAKSIARRFMHDIPAGMSQRFSWHMARHSLCTHLLCERGVDPVHVARTMGHSPECLSRFYLHATKDILKDLRLAS